MFNPEKYIASLITLLKDAFGERLRYVGLQGSYLRGEATEHSDIDIMVVIKHMTAADLSAYRTAVESLENFEKSCGFICGMEEMQHWNPLEICHLMHTTKDYLGVLADLVPQYTAYDVRTFVKLSIGNLYHEICHRHIHAPMERNRAALPHTYKQVFCILQNLFYLENGRFIGTKKELLASLSGKDRLVLEKAISLGSGAAFDFDEAFALLYSWCRETLARTSSITGASLRKYERNQEVFPMKAEIYLHGQVLGTHSFLLRGDFPQPDSYSEINERYFLPGGETGTAATVLSSLGANVKIDGTHIGREPAELIRSFYADKTVDLSSLYFDPEWEGLVDHVLIAGPYRTPLGRFQHLYEIGIKRWNAPREQDIIDCRAAGIDPYFGEETQMVAELCVKHHKPYVTIDCRHDTYLHQHAAINVLSHECTDGDYKGYTLEEVYDLLIANTEGLVIITAGEKGMYYGRKGQPMKHMPAFKVDVRSTLGAGDTYKAGCVYALLHGMSDEETVRFAAACSGVAISRFPLPLNPPTLEEVNALLAKEN